MGQALYRTLNQGVTRNLEQLLEIIEECFRQEIERPRPLQVMPRPLPGLPTYWPPYDRYRSRPSTRSAIPLMPIPPPLPRPVRQSPQSLPTPPPPPPPPPPVPLSPVPVAVPELDDDALRKVMNALYSRERMIMRLMDTFCYAEPLRNRKIVFTERLEDPYESTMNAYFPGYKIFFVNSWAAIAQVMRLAILVDSLVFYHCAFQDIDEIIQFQQSLSEVKSLRIYHFRQDGTEPHPYTNTSMAYWNTDQRLSSNTRALEDFEYQNDTCTDVGQPLIQAVVNNNPSLKRLSLHETTTWSNISISNSLTSLTVNRRNTMGDAFWQTVYNTSAESLEQLIFRNPMILGQQANIPQFPDLAVFRNLKDLRLIRLFDAPEQPFFFSRLEVLCIHYYTDNILASLAPNAENLIYTFQHHSQLKILDIDGKFQNEQSLETIVESCPLLEDLRIHINFELTDFGEAQILQLQRLQCLRILTRESLPDERMARIVRGIPSLRCLYYQGQSGNFNVMTFLAMSSRARHMSRSGKRCLLYSPNAPEHWTANNLILIIVLGALFEYFEFSLDASITFDYNLWKHIRFDEDYLLQPELRIRLP